MIFSVPIQVSDIEKAMASIKENIEADPIKALSDLRGLFCHARSSKLEVQHEIVYLMGVSHFYTGSYDTARKLIEGWLRVCPKESEWRTRLLIAYAATLQVTGYYTDAFTTFEIALTDAIIAKNLYATELIYHNLIKLLNIIGAFNEAVTFYHKLQPFVKDNPTESARVAVIYSWTLANLGDSQAGLSLLDEAYRYYEGCQDLKRMGYVWEARGEIHLYLKRYDEALECLINAKKLLDQFGDAKDLCRINKLLGQGYMAIGAVELAIVALQESIYSASVAKLPLLIDESYFNLGNCLLEVGERDFALETFKLHVELQQKNEVLRNHQQTHVLNLMLEKYRVISDHQTAILRQNQLQALRAETTEQSKKLKLVTERFSNLRQFALELTRCSGYRGIIATTLSKLGDFLSFTKGVYGEWDDIEQCYVIHDFTMGIIGMDFFDIWSDNHNHILERIKTHYALTEVLYQPIVISDGRLKLILCVMNEADHPFDNQERSLLNAIVALVESAIQLSLRIESVDEQKAMHNLLLEETKLRHEELINFSYIDELTGLYNRSGMYFCLEQWENSEVFPQDIVAVVFDLDHFKEYNDDYGHLAGDALLKAFGNLIQTAFNQPNYLLSRIGGEEFLLLASSRYLWDINSICNQLIKDVTKLAVNSDLKGNVTISVGLANGNVQELKNIYQLIEKADQELYRAKKQGRNQVCVSMGE